MDTVVLVMKVAALIGGAWAFIDWWRKGTSELDAWERAEAMRRANEYIKRHEVPKSSHPFR
jgi:hypothetical protein